MSIPWKDSAILTIWKRKNLSATIDAARADSPRFNLYDGPPFATGLPHYGHLLTATIKDVIQRFWTMRGYSVPRHIGWDCHGLPVENEVEKLYSLLSPRDIEEFGIANFNKACSQLVRKYTSQWPNTMSRLGCDLDFSKAYKTMDLSFMESVWWVFGQLYAQDLVYEGFKVLPLSPKLGTALSNFEANLNYQTLEDPSVAVCFPLDSCVSFLIWTTTPWTLVANRALGVNPDARYVNIEVSSKQRYILAEEAVQHFFDDYLIVDRYLGSDLTSHKAHSPFDKGVVPVIAADFVSTAEGTGIVHLAPGFGEDDFFACQKVGIPPFCPVDMQGRFTADISQYQGMPVREVNPLVIEELRQSKLLFSAKSIQHRYPCCWRTDVPLIYKAMNSWFIAVEKIKERIIQQSWQIEWIPKHIKQGRFAHWLEQARDWSISRQRFWGTPIPLWRSEGGDIAVISSRQELEERTGKKIKDLHRHAIDRLCWEERGKLYKRIPDVFDCWFESGAVPYARLHYPFSARESFEKSFPADCIAEGLDQTRGWFYTLLVLGTALFDKTPFRRAVVNGIVLAADGTKMSKRLQNYPLPEKILEKYGADALRLYLLKSPASSGDDLCFSSDEVVQISRQVLIPLWNAFQFFQTYRRIEMWQPSQSCLPTSRLNIWILSLTHSLARDVKVALEGYDFQSAVRSLTSGIDALTNWYIRRSRVIFWSNDHPECQESFSTLYRVLKTISWITAPLCPFISEAIYRELRDEDEEMSVHLCSFPEGDSDEELEQEMSVVRQAVALGHAIRKEKKLRVRQPLKKAVISCQQQRLEKYRQLICDELHVQELEIEKENTLPLQGKARFAVLGKRAGECTREIATLINSLDQESLQKLKEGKEISLDLRKGTKWKLMPDEVVLQVKPPIGTTTATAEGMTVLLDTELDEGLIEEGIARDLIHVVNALRKEEKLQITDRIVLALKGSETFECATQNYLTLIQQETLSICVVWTESEGVTTKVGEYDVQVKIEVVDQKTIEGEVG